MLNKIIVSLYATAALAQILPPAKITQPDPATPAALSVFADEGDSTYCVFTASPGYKALAKITCRRAGVTIFTSDPITETTTISIGDLCWMIVKRDPVILDVQVSANVRDKTGAVVWVLPPLPSAEFQVGEQVAIVSPVGAALASARVAHWSHSSGTIYRDTTTSQSYVANLTLSSIVAVDPAWATPDASIVGQTSGARSMFGGSSPLTGNKMKSWFVATWQTPRVASAAFAAPPIVAASSAVAKAVASGTSQGVKFAAQKISWPFRPRKL